MTGTDANLVANDRCLAAALAWLRLRLRQAAGEGAPAVPPTPGFAGEAAGVRGEPPSHPDPSPGRPGLFGRLVSRLTRWSALPEPLIAAAAAAPADEAPPARPGGEGETAAARAAFDAALAADPAPALAVLQREFGLDDAERDTLLLAAAPELDPAVTDLVAAAQSGWADGLPTFRLAVGLFGYWNVVTPTAALRWHKLIEVYQPGGRPITAAAIRADERVVNFLKGVNSLDDQLRSYLSEIPSVGHALLRTQQSAADQLLAALRPAGPRGGLVQLLGPDPSSKALVAGRVAQQLGRALYRLPAEVLPTSAAALDDLARLWNRESRLLPLALYLDTHEADAHTPAAAAVGRFVERADGGPILLAAREPLPLPPMPSADVARPTPDEQRAVWRHLLRQYYAPPKRSGPPPPAPPERDLDAVAGRLAAQFNLNAPAIAQAFRAAVRPAAAPPPPAEFGERLWAAALAAARPRIDALAQRLGDPLRGDSPARRPILPPAEQGLLDQIVAHVRHRGRVLDDWRFRGQLGRGQGLSVLFAGESGTGKTMAAEWLARELRLTLYRVDPAQAFDKYIGETPKNFRRLFDAAEDGGVILFFDEADTYFGKRTEVRDSHDRYANLEVNYLLQRMETFRGVAILATNMRRALDAAFLRRLNFVVEFPFPQPSEREAIWRQSFPPAAAGPPAAAAPSGLTVSLSDADYRLLGLFRLTGGSIRTAAVAAAYAAAAEEARARRPQPLGPRHALAAGLLECQKFNVEPPAEVRAWLAKNPPPADDPPAPAGPPARPARERPAALPARAAGGGA